MNDKKTKLENLDKLLSEELLTYERHKSLEDEINRSWIEICNEFYDRGKSFSTNKSILDNFLEENCPGLKDKMLNYSERCCLDKYINEALKNSIKREVETMKKK